MKKFTLNDKQKLYLRVALVVIYFGILLALVLNARVAKMDANGNALVQFGREAFTIPFINRPIYFYALAIVTGIGAAYFYANHIAKKIGFSQDNLFDGFIIGVVLGILGARIWYVLFEWGSFKNNPLKILTGFLDGEGGLAIHGGIIAAGIFAYFFCKRRKEDILKLGEMLFPGFLIGQIFGRWGNFFNQEAHGGPISTSIQASRNFLESFRVIPKFVIDQMYIGNNYMHPTFLYESVWNFIGLILVIVLRNKVKKYWYGDAILFYLVWYGTGRFFVEMLRTDALTFNLFGMELRTAMVISAIMIIAGVTLFVLRRIFKYKPISYIEIVEENKLANLKGE